MVYYKESSTRESALNITTSCSDNDFKAGTDTLKFNKEHVKFFGRNSAF